MTDWREKLREFLDSQPRDYEYISASEIIRAEPRPWKLEEFLDEIKDICDGSDNPR
jgi:hypothetical protein